MLKSVRHAAKSGFSYILVAGLIVIFAFFFGVPADGCGSSPNAPVHMATVAGDSVDTKDISVIYNQLYGSKTTTDEAELQRQRALSLKAYLMIELLAHKAREAGLRVGEDEFKEYILDPLRNPEFLSAYGSRGGYDADYYRNYVENFLMVSRPKYERFKKDELLARKYINMAEMQIGVIPQEIAQLEKLRNTKINLEFARFQPQAMADMVTVSDDDVAAYIAANPDAIQKYYESHIADYSQKAEMEIRRIYLERDSAGPDGKNAEQRLAEAKARIEKGEDFADVAGTINDALKDQQGFMAMSPVENMDQNIVQALEGAKVGDVRDVTTDSALMLVKLLDKKDATKTPLADVKDEIARTLLQEQKVNAIIAEMAAQLQAKAKETGSLTSALDALKASGEDGAESNDAWAQVTADETGEFTLEGQDMSGMFGGQLPPGISLGRSAWDNIPKIGQSRALAVDAFNKLSEKSPVADQIYTVNDSKFVVSLKSKTTAPKDAEATADADEDKAAGEAGESNDELTEELIAKKTQTLLGPWQRLFSRRTQFGAALTLDYGPWLEQQYKEAVNTGVIKLDKKSGGAAVAMIDPTTVAVTPSGGALELSPTELGSGESAQ